MPNMDLRCRQCGWTGRRYHNVKRCPGGCGGWETLTSVAAVPALARKPYKPPRVFVLRELSVGGGQ